MLLVAGMDPNRSAVGSVIVPPLAGMFHVFNTVGHHEFVYKPGALNDHDPL